MKTFQTRYLQQQFFSSWLYTQLTYTLTGKRINLASISAVIRLVHSFSYLWCWPSWLRCYSHLLRYGPPTVLYLLLYYWSHATLWHMIIITSSKFHRKRMHLWYRQQVLMLCLWPQYFSQVGFRKSARCLYYFSSAWFSLDLALLSEEW